MHTKDKLILDKNIKIILNKPLIGEPKKGDLLGIFVYKFKINKQEYLLAYKLLPNQSNIEQIELISFGSHENFYNKLKI